MLYKDELDDFRYGQKVKGKGALALVVQLTRAFSKDSLPIDPADYVTGKQGQVAGLESQISERFLPITVLHGSLQKRRAVQTGATWGLCMHTLSL